MLCYILNVRGELMKKFFTLILLFLVLIGAAGYGIWHFGTDIASEKILENVETSLNDQNIEAVNTYVKNDPKLQEIVNEAATTNPDTLPFQTKEEATRVIIKKVGVNRLLDIKEQAENGSINQEAILTEIESLLTEDEITALKYVVYKEFNRLSE